MADENDDPVERIVAAFRRALKEDREEQAAEAEAKRLAVEAEAKAKKPATDWLGRLFPKEGSEEEG